MIFPVVESRSHVDHRVAGQRAMNHRLLNAFFHRWDVLLWNCASDYLVYKLELRVLVRRELHPHVTELAAPSTLLLVATFSFGSGSNGFPVRNLGLAKIDIHAKLAFEAFHRNSKVGLAYSGKYCLTGLGIPLDMKRWIFLTDALQRGAEFV